MTGADIAPRQTRPGRWQWPAPPLRVLLLVLAVALVGLAWAQRGVFFRVAQSAILQEQADDPVHPGAAPNRIDASVRWSFVPAGANGPAIVGDFDIPATGARLKLSIRKNADPAVPASHIIEIVASPPDFADKTIDDVDSLVAKGNPDGPGTSLIGSVAEIGDGTFWIGLSPAPEDLRVNLRLLALGAFFDLNLKYQSGQHAVLTFEKGQTGVAVFNEGLPALFR